jgi:hypothetical protein
LVVDEDAFDTFLSMPLPREKVVVFAFSETGFLANAR